MFTYAWLACCLPPALTEADPSFRRFRRPFKAPAKPSRRQRNSTAQRTSEAAAAASGYTSLYSFRGSKVGDGGTPNGDLAVLDGVLYGTTSYAGAGGYECGTVFAVTTSGAERVVHSFQNGASFGNSDGCEPSSGLLALNGTLYGTTLFGGDVEGAGTLYSVTKSGAERVIYTFTRGFGGPSEVPVSLNGVLYGGLSGAGPGTAGSIFGISPSGALKARYDFKFTPPTSEHVLYRFRGGASGSGPNYLVFANGALYGTSGGGDSHGDGLVFELSLAGQPRVLYRFKGGSDGAAPNGLILVNGALYGTTNAGGASGKGTV